MKATLLALVAVVLFTSCKGQIKKEEKEALSKQPASTVKTAVGDITLPSPFATESASKRNDLIDWPEGKMPVAPAGFTVSKFAEKLEKPRWAYVAPNNDVFVAESEAGRITLYRDADKEGNYETHKVYLKGLNKPFGMLILNNYIYVANTDYLVRFPYTAAEMSNSARTEKIMELPGGSHNRHWTRNIIANREGTKIYVAVGSGSNVAENGLDNEKNRARIFEINPDGTGQRVYASGLRNPVGMDWNPVTGELWTAVNERDELGDELVPDYITSVKDGGFYGWPFSYFGNHLDPRMKGAGKDLAQKAIIPDVAVGSHTASLGLAFYTKNSFPSTYKNGIFIGQHGSWNRSTFSGYKVVFVPFKNGKPAGPMQDFLTGFIADEANSKVYGRPVGVTVMPDGSLLVMDDGSNIIWRVAMNK